MHDSKRQAIYIFLISLMQRWFFPFVKIGRGVVGIYQYFITGFLRGFFVYMAVQAASVVSGALCDVSGVNGRRNAFFVVRGTAVIYFRAVDGTAITRSTVLPGFCMMLPSLETKSCIVVPSALKMTVAGEDNEYV